MDIAAEPAGTGIGEGNGEGKVSQSATHSQLPTLGAVAPFRGKNQVMPGSKKITPKTLKAMHSATAKGDPHQMASIQMVLSANHELPFPAILQAAEEQLMDVVDQVEASGPFYSTPVPMWDYPMLPMPSSDPTGVYGSNQLPMWTYPMSVDPTMAHFAGCPWAASRQHGKNATTAPSVIVVHTDKNETILCNLLKTVKLPLYYGTFIDLKNPDLLDHSRQSQLRFVDSATRGGEGQ